MQRAGTALTSSAQSGSALGGDQRGPAPVKLNLTGGGPERIAAAFRRRRALQGPVEPVAHECILRRAAEATAVLPAGITVCGLDTCNESLRNELLRLNEKLLPNKVCTEALRQRLLACRPPSCCLLATAAAGVGAATVDLKSNSHCQWPAIAGFVLCECSRGEASVVLLAVEGSYRQQGCGAALLASALAQALEGGQKLASLCVRRDNAAAIALYTKMGMSPSGGDTDTATMVQIFNESV